MKVNTIKKYESGEIFPLLSLFIVVSLQLKAQGADIASTGTFDQYFYHKTLRIDFELGGNADTTIVFLKEMKEEPFWGGPVKNLTDPFSYGNFRYRVYEANSNKLLYEKGFGSLFEEWQATQEAKSLNRTFYQVATMPYPKTKIRFEIDDRSYATGKFATKFSREIDPQSYFILKEQTRYM
ncbi:MAG: peptidase M64 N-terminal domain-containing protein [Cyclobacteriaceae bacterium]|nr:peptidase M64 N-terminal domain-containing protein [Cyclobacteriaceae bacterium]